MIDWCVNQMSTAPILTGVAALRNLRLIRLPSNLARKSYCMWVGGVFCRPYTPRMEDPDMVKLNETNPSELRLNWLFQKDFGGISD